MNMPLFVLFLSLATGLAAFIALVVFKSRWNTQRRATDKAFREAMLAHHKHYLEQQEMKRQAFRQWLAHNK
jgi:hypothetical protein